MKQILKLQELKNSYIPIKLNQGGIMPLVFSTTIATFLFYPFQLAFNNWFKPRSKPVNKFFNFLFFFVLNIVLVIFFSSFYALLGY